MIRSFLVAKREFLENVRTKGFWIGILMMPVMLVLVILLPILAESAREAKTYVVVDQSGQILETVKREIEISDLVLVLKNQGIPDILDQAPGVIKTIKRFSGELSSEEIRALAVSILDGEQTDSSNYPAELQRQLKLHSPEITHWWHKLTPETRAMLAPGVSTDQFTMVPYNNQSIDDLNEGIRDDTLFAYFIIGSDPIENSDGFKYVSNNLTDRDLLNWFSSFVNRKIQTDRLKLKSIDPEISAWINRPARFEGIQISGDGHEEEVQATDIFRQWAPVAFVYLLWIAIMINTQMLLTNTIEEKSNKLIEVLLSSISPVTLMAGKIMGIAATGLALIGCWLLIVLVTVAALPGTSTEDTAGASGITTPSGIQLPFDLSSIIQDPFFLGSFLVYFVLGYLFYAALLVGLGSICNNLKEAQNLTLPVQMFQIVPLLIMIPIGRDPNGAMAQALSYFPPFTPFVMMNRAAAPPTNFEYVTTTVLMIISIVAALWFAAKIFRVGILLTGKPPKFKEVIRWLRAPT